MRTIGILLLLASALPADVVVLKGGVRVPGKVVEKADHYEVTSEGVLRTYLKDEVEKVVTSPKEFLGGADKLFEEARADYQRALTLAEGPDKNAFLKETIGKVARARESYTVAIDLFPDDASLGKQLMLLVQLTRLLRDRVHLDESRRPDAPAGTSASTPVPAPLAADDGLSTLVDPARRNDPARRAAALANFRAQHSDLATAAALFLSKTDAEMKIDGAALKAVQDYFQKPWIRESARMTPAAHLEAAQWLASLRAKADSAAAAEALVPFAIVHLSAAGPGPDAEKAAHALGLMFQNGLIGTPEGHAIRDLDSWIANGEFDLAVMAFVNEYRSIDTVAVRYVWSYALLRLVTARKRGFERPVSALASVPQAGTGIQEHLAALAKSIKAVATCNICLGAGKLRCTNCHGQKVTKFICQRCKGKGYTINSLGTKILCNPCRSTGIASIVKCEKCKDGYVDCKQCDHKPHTPPEMDDILSAAPCTVCEGRGMAFRNAAVPCRACLGLGIKLVPKADPSKVLP